MAQIPLVYNVESVRTRWTSAVVAVAGIAGTVAVFIAMLAMAQGFRATLVKSGSPENAFVRRAGASSEMDSIISLEDVRVVEDAPGVARQDGVALVSPEVIVIAALPLASDHTADANVQVRGVGRNGLLVHRGIRIREGRPFSPGLAEVVVGKNALLNYAGLRLGGQVVVGGRTWEIVGVMDGGGSSFDSEIWADADLVNDAYQRPRTAFQSMTVGLVTPQALDGLRNNLLADPRVKLQVEGEPEYYARSSQALSMLITTLGTLVAVVMGFGAVFGALNTMYSAVAERSREVATLRAIGFGAKAVVLSFVAESLFIAVLGGVAGCLLALPVNGLTTGTMNWQTFSHLAFAFKVTPALLGLGLLFAVVMGLVGGVPPAIRAARMPVAAALRDL
jgi:putative ABC transport system permease protein